MKELKTKVINENYLTVSFRLKENGFNVEVFGTKRYGVFYKNDMFSSLDLKAKEALLTNFIYAWTRPLTLLTKIGLFYKSDRPLLKKFIDYGIVKDLPRIAEVSNIKTEKLITEFNKFNNQKGIIFQVGKIGKILPQRKISNKKAILALSFGKDSLLSYGVAKEIGLDCNIVTTSDVRGHNQEYSEVENKHKTQIVRSFIKNEQTPIDFVTDNVDEIFSNKKIKSRINDLEDTNGMLTFVLGFIPVSYFYQAKYIILGNEANFSDSFKNKDGFKTYPSFDQTAIYTERENQYLSSLTNGNVEAISLVEPIYNLAEMVILYNRYPHLLPYVMSCYPEEPGSDKWCYNCPMCAKAFVFSVAVGGDPKKIGLKKNLFEKKYKKLYPLFSKKITRVYEKPRAVRDEQLLSFLLAYRLGWQGDLINLFKKTYLAEAERKEKVLRKKFFGIHSSLTIPQDIKSKVINIYRQELKSFL